MPLYFPRKPEPPAQAKGSTYRGQMPFAQRMNYARGIHATTAQEATQLIPLIEQLLKQVSRFINSQSQQEAYNDTKSKLSDIHGSLPVITGPTYSTDTPKSELDSEQQVFADEVEPFPEDDTEYSDEDKQGRAKELQQALEKSVERDIQSTDTPTPVKSVPVKPAPKKRGRPKKK